MENKNTKVEPLDDNQIELYRHVSDIKSTQEFKNYSDAQAERAFWIHSKLEAQLNIRNLEKYEQKAKKELEDLLKDSVQNRSFVIPQEMGKGTWKKIVLFFFGSCTLASVVFGIALYHNVKVNSDKIVAPVSVDKGVKPSIIEKIIPAAHADEPAEANVSTAKAMSVYTSFMQKKNPELVKCAVQVVSHPRWVEAVGILGIETSFCTKGYGVTSNNCGKKCLGPSD